MPEKLEPESSVLVGNSCFLKFLSLQKMKFMFFEVFKLAKNEIHVFEVFKACKK